MGPPGSASDTPWGFRELAYQHVGLAAMIFGLAVLLVVLIHWLWMSPTERKG